MLNTIINGDCLDIMPAIPDRSIDLILADLPYGKTQANWDSVIELAALWEQYTRLIKDDGAIVLTSSQPFTSMLVMSNPSWYRYTWVWNKGRGMGLNAKKQPIPKHEDILIFSRHKSPTYYPQKKKLDKPATKSGKLRSTLIGDAPGDAGKRVYTDCYPGSILDIPQDRADHCHPTQKPVALFAYLIETYTLPSQVVLDNVSGSGTTAIAAIRTGRQYICIERDTEHGYYEASLARVAAEGKAPIMLAPRRKAAPASSRQMALFGGI